MRDHGGFGEEGFYDLNDDGELDLFEEANMHAEQYWEMTEMFDDPQDDRSTRENHVSFSSTSANTPSGGRVLRKFVAFIFACGFYMAINESGNDSLFAAFFISLLVAAF